MACTVTDAASYGLAQRLYLKVGLSGSVDAGSDHRMILSETPDFGDAISNSRLYGHNRGQNI
jgi:hypothetical protein